jgi:hypothetical protein
MRWFMGMVVLACLPLTCRADPDMLLRELARRGSSFILAVEVVAEPVVQSADAKGVFYHVDVKVLRVVKEPIDLNDGKALGLPAKQEVHLVFALGKRVGADGLELKKGARYVLFLDHKFVNKLYVPGDLIDEWLGIQPYSAILVEHLAALVKDWNR